MKILIIEDEALIQMAISRYLKKKGCNVDSTNSGNEAISILNSSNYDFIICDLMLKDITGFDVLEASKKFFSSLELSKKFILITAYGSPRIHEKANLYGCNIIEKPFTSLTILDKFLIPSENKNELSI